MQEPEQLQGMLGGCWQSPPSKLHGPVLHSESQVLSPCCIKNTAYVGHNGLQSLDTEITRVSNHIYIFYDDSSYSYDQQLY